MANIFEDVQNKRLKMKDFAKAAYDRKWIEKSVYDEIVGRLDQDILTIGVIGQMKCGKSTFLNAFLFEDDVLPAATTPMTAALSLITYGEKKEIEAEFYDSKEWDEMKMTAARSLEEVKDDAVQTSKIKAAKELVDKAQKLGSRIPSLLGTKKKDEFDNLIEYVGADGRYVAITKSVSIFYPKEWLKGVEIVDTPGFNDPVVSREERTQEFLKKADVVVLLLYAGRAFDSTDRDILFEKVQNVGVGKILIGVNKYDLCFAQGETKSEIKDNVSKEIIKACKESGDELINELLKDLEPILFSANMALMAKMPINKINEDADLKFHWDKACNDFDISNQDQMLEKSLIGELEESIQNLINKSKQEIIIKKPLNMILQSGLNAKKGIELKLNEYKRLIESLSIPDSELDEKILNLEKAQRRIQKRADRAIEEMDEAFDETLTNAIHRLEDITDSAHNDMINIVNTEKRSQIGSRFKNRWSLLSEREIPREEKNLKKNLRSILIDKDNEFCDEVEEEIRKYLPDSEELIEDIKLLINKYSLEIDAINEEGDEEEDNQFDYDFFDIIEDFIKGILILPAIIDWANARNDWRDRVDESFDGIDFNGLENNVQSIKEQFTNLLQTKAVTDILAKLMEQLEEVKNNKDSKEEKLKNAEEQVASLENDKSTIEAQLKEMEMLKGELL
jgi:hypothetical protein